MKLEPKTIGELSQSLAACHGSDKKITGINLSALHRVLEYSPEDMTVTVEAGITLAKLQAELAQHAQWLPIDPSRPERLTMAALLANDESGPRRFGYGVIRDYLLGIKVMLADERVISAGGKVVKNVAGYDLCKLFVGSRGTLGIILEATFKLGPLPEMEKFVQTGFESFEKAEKVLNAVLESELSPVVLDMHNLKPGSRKPEAGTNVVLGFAGTREDVEWQLTRAVDLGAKEPSSLGYETEFWLQDSGEPLHRLSVLPSHGPEALSALRKVPFVARAGNGLIWYRGGPEPKKPGLPAPLTQRIKDAYDPKHIFPALTI